MKSSAYSAFIQDIDNRATHMKEALLLPIIDQNTGGILENAKARNERLERVTPHSIFENIGKGAATVQAVAANAIGAYCKRYGEAPPDDLLASAHMAISNAFEVLGDNKGQFVSGVFESAAMSTTEGLLMRDRMIALVLPIVLHSITSRMCTHIPGTFNQSEIFRIRRQAGSTFGDLAKNDIIDHTFNGQYSSMDQRHKTGTGDGAATGSSNEFDLDSESGLGVVMPFKRKRVRIVYDHGIVAKDDGEGVLSGTFKNGSEVSVTVTGTVTYDTGVVHPVFSVAPENDIEIHVMIDIDIEKDPSLIPLMEYIEDSKTVYPHESAINAGFSPAVFVGCKA